ncbi:MAG: 50S ribosomal protein L15 [Sphaerochaetaceae bacterium]|jgi:large subunit ribosomal protein L15|nr:50S ribosomal protein L15 [Sphaerochaetaceae bacterium]MDD3162862.1 50S ribosomal protein L15 [Sphaerochaetaceae bacterium]MDD4006451.1 50S ribosomal protein L15 [Sphaerochaetaceae bacterium]MDD4396374.1 50S ribosomal protein L15 [Sphaerochaetaceae bacterium]
MAQIVKPEGATVKKQIVGRGASSKGRTCGRGHDGQNSRSGGGTRPGFEGGQMPLYRKVARRGFSNYPFKKEYVAISLDVINEKFEDGETVSLDTLKDKMIVKGLNVLVKILADGDIKKKVIIDGLKVSASAAEKIKAAGGEIK